MATRLPLLAILLVLLPAAASAQSFQRSPAGAFAPLFDAPGSGGSEQIVALRASRWQLPIVSDDGTAVGETELRSLGVQFLAQGKPGQYLGFTLGVQQQGECEETVGCLNVFLLGLHGYATLWQVGGSEDRDAPRAFVGIHGGATNGNQYGQEAGDQWSAFLAGIPIGVALGGGEGFGISGFVAPGFSLGSQRFRLGTQTDAVLSGGLSVDFPAGFALQISAQRILTRSDPIPAQSASIAWSEGTSLDIGLSRR